ncbi:MAG TPA: ABC transporter permease, partial [Longimicrobiaceae bacterium]|nr:ABC transporter permease [Longimicrobiaceae bacterium]
MHPSALFAALRQRLRALFRRGDVESDWREEIRFHLEMEEEKNLRAGMSSAEARRAARLAFGGVDRMSEAHRDARGTRLLEDALADLRYAARTLARTPGFVAVSVFTLAIAIAVGTSLFTGVNGFFYRPLPVPGGGELVALFTSDFSSGEVRGASSYPDLASFSREAAGVAELAGEARVTLAIEAGDAVALAPGALVSPGYFRTLRVKPALGRLPAGASADAPALVLGHGLWRRTFASDPSVIGRAVKVNGHSFQVAAVAPPAFLGTTREAANEFWIDAAFAPLLLPRDELLARRDSRRFHLVGRLNEGASIDQLRARLGIAAARLYQDEPAAWADTTGRARRVSVLPEREARLAGVSRGDLLLVVGGVVALGLGLLALACTNLASLQMARTAARRREIATRLALGAGRGRLVRQLLAESALIALPGALLGLLLAAGFSSTVMHYRPAGLPNFDMSLDARALAFTAGGLLLALLVLGLMPALQGLRADLLTHLKDGYQPGRRGIPVGGMRGALIIAQVALSVTLTAGSAVVALALGRYARDSLVDGERVLVAPLTLLPAAGDSLRAAALVREIVQSLERVPGVQAVSAARFVPVPGTRMTVEVGERDAAGAAGSRSLEANGVLPRYFAVTGLPLLRGREFEEREMGGSPRVAMVSRVMAQRLWPGEDPIGKTLDVEGAPVEVIGVVGELRADPLNPAQSPAAGLLYLPLRTRSEGELVLHLRTAGPAAAVAPQVARELRRESTRVVASDVLPMGRYLDRAVMPTRIMARASGLLAALQWLLAIAGLSGLVAYVTAL